MPIFTSNEQSSETVTQNQILVNFRTTAGSDVEWMPFFLTMELQAIRKGDRDFFSEDMKDHATKVLTRMQGLYGEDE